MTQRRRLAIGGMAIVATAIAVIAFTLQERRSGPPAPSEGARISGAAIYAAQCANCHGANLEGQANWRERNEDGVFPAPPHDADGHTWHHPDSVLFAYTKFGGQEAMRRMGVEGVTSGMPGFAGQLADEEIRAVLNFVKSTWSERMRSYQEEQTRQTDDP